MKRRAPRPPWRVALIAFGATIVIGLVVGLIVMEARPRGDMTPFERGEAMGNALGLLGFVIAAVAYVIAWRRQQKSSER